jgi:hypothetical protein
VEQRNPGADAHRGDQAIERPADGDAAAACAPVQLSGEGEIVEPVQPQEGKRAQVLLDLVGLAIRSQALSRRR